MKKPTHFDDAGRARMVEVGAKTESPREATASGAVHMCAETLEQIEAGKVGKGDVLGVARLAALCGLKRTSDLIPLCHPVRITGADIDLEPRSDGQPRVEIRATVRAFDRTGVEMEALTAVSIAALTLYDMCKAIDRDMCVAVIQLESKRGGKSGAWARK